MVSQGNRRGYCLVLASHPEKPALPKPRTISEAFCGFCRFAEAIGPIGALRRRPLPQAASVSPGSWPPSRPSAQDVTEAVVLATQACQASGFRRALPSDPGRCLPCRRAEHAAAARPQAWRSLRWPMTQTGCSNRKDCTITDCSTSGHAIRGGILFSPLSRIRCSMCSRNDAKSCIQPLSWQQSLVFPGRRAVDLRRIRCAHYCY
jgi:hypothetical protein